VYSLIAYQFKTTPKDEKKKFSFAEILLHKAIALGLGEFCK